MSDFKICSNCGATIHEFVQYCPRCRAKQGSSLSDDEVQKNPYNILQVSPDAEPEVIQAAYKSLARKYHPDLVGSSASEERMKELNWAYQILSNPEKRKEWTRKHQRKYESAPNKEASHRQPPSSYAPPERTGTQASGYARSTQTSPDPSQVLRSQKVKKGFPWYVVFAIIIMLCALLSKISSFLDKTSSISNAPSSTIKTSTPIGPKPTSTAPRPSPTPECISWSKISLENVGDNVCVFGYVKHWYSTEDYATIIRFSEDANHFIMFDVLYEYPDLDAGSCVSAEGYIQRMGQMPALNINGSLYKCP